MSELLEALDGADDVDRETGDAALLRAMLDVEAALARALARAGLAPAEAAEAIEATCTELVVDARQLGRRSRDAGNPVIPLVDDLGAAVPESARGWVHRGATSQDILDTALMLVAHRALGPLLGSLAQAADQAARLAEEHRGTPAIARTLGQPALPTTFGRRAAGWCAGLDSAQRRLDTVRDRELAVQFGGATGTLAALDGAGLEVARLLADQLGLVDPEVPWHTERSRVHALAGGLATATAATAKVATDVVLGSAAEVGELAEGGKAGLGGSSAMPHKRNPMASVLVVAAARRTPGLLATVLTAGVHEHERATGSWHAEWQPLRDLVRLTGGAAARTATLLTDLRVDPARMRANLDAAGPAVMSERLAIAFASLGRAEARALVRGALAASSDGTPLRDVLLADPRVSRLCTPADLDALLNPLTYLGSADEIVTRVLARRRGGDR
ncbi:MAG: 3-carboxy-cis,cis-muconate cycloisomerase [Nocardioidaceae bacterium]